MENSDQIASRLEEVLLKGKWIANTNYIEIASDISYEQANIKIGNLNTIAILVQHISYYVNGVLNVFINGELNISDKNSFSFQEINLQKEWLNILTDFSNNSLKLIQQVRNLNDSQLDDIFIDKKYGTYRRNIEAMIEHCYYHLGQISLIKKMVLEKNKL